MNNYKPVLFLRKQLMHRQKRLLALHYRNRQHLQELQLIFSADRRHQRRRKLAALLLLPLLLSMSNPAAAAEQQEQTAADEEMYTLAQIIQQVQQHNRIYQQYQLNLDLLEESRTKAKNTRRDVQSTLNSVYDKESDAYRSLSTIGQNQAAVQQGMQAIQQQIAAAHPGISPAELQKLLASNSSYLALQAQMTALTGMENQLDSGISSAEDAIEQLWDGLDEVDTTVRTIENKQDDVTKSQEDWNEEVKLVTNLLVRKTVTMEHTQDLLEQKAALLQKQYAVALKQEEIGLSVPVKTKDIQLSIQETATQLQQVKDGVHLLKRQLNDMMGRSLDASLPIKPVPETGYVANIPTYSADLLKQVKDNSYTLKTLQRDIDNYKEDAQDLKDKGQYESDTLKIYDLNIELSKVSIKDTEASLDNSLKKLIDEVNVTGQIYQETIDGYQNATAKYQQNKKYAEVGLISPLTLQAAGLEYEQAALTRQQAAYDYALAKLEYEAFLKGTDLSIYEQYKGL